MGRLHRGLWVPLLEILVLQFWAQTWAGAGGGGGAGGSVLFKVPKMVPSCRQFRGALTENVPVPS